MGREAYSPEQLSETPYSHAIVENGNLYMAGQVARDADGNIVGDDLETQSRKVFENIEVILDAVGKELSDVAKVTVYIIGDHDSLDGYKKVYNETFEEPYPCQTVLGTRSLGGSNVMIEIEAEVPMD